jgi:hypothetical protein
MMGRFLATAAALSVLASSAALAQQAVLRESVTADTALPSPLARSSQVGPHMLPDRTAAALASSAWSAQDVQLAQARCNALLKGLDVVAVPEAPLHEGTDCGTPVPMRLISIGRSPQVALSPPPTVTCDMIAAMKQWLEQDVQPLAHKHLGASVIRIETMSSYSCRNAYGRAKSKLSEHARANAIDIASFVTAHGLTAMVLTDWGLTAREVVAKVQQGGPQRAAPAAHEVALAQKTAGALQPITPRTIVNPAVNPAVNPGVDPGANPGVLHALMPLAVPGISVQLPGLSNNPPTALGLLPSHLGGPKVRDGAGDQTPGTGDGRMDFLRSAHRAACKIFSTVLGPEANSAHRNHFHVDMAERVQHMKICE